MASRVVRFTVLAILSLTLGFFFIFMGSLKLTPAINNDVYRQMRKVFIREAKVFPFIGAKKYFDPQIYRKVIGTHEVVAGVIMAFIPGRLKLVANLTLLIEMALELYTHIALKDEMERMTPCVIFGMLLICRYIVYLQALQREKAATEEEEQSQSSSKTIEPSTSSLHVKSD